MISLGFIGSGTVGTALAVKLSEQGYPVVAASSRSLSSAERLASRVTGCRVCHRAQEVADAAEMVFITTPDDAIRAVAASLRWRPGQMVVHCSGADSTEALEAARWQGVQVGVFHPLQTFAGVAQALENIPGSTFGLEASGPLLGILKEMAIALGGTPVVLTAQEKVLYHAAAVIACNYVVTLMKMATDLWQLFGVPRHEATRSLLPLLKGTLNNIENIGLPNCLTGPIARGDVGTVEKHLLALGEAAPELLSAYRELALQTIPVALAKGRLGEEEARELRALLTAEIEEQIPELALLIARG